MRQPYTLPAAIALMGILAMPVGAGADPTIDVPDVPPTSKGVLWRGGGSHVALVGEIDVLAVLAASEQSTYPAAGDIDALRPDVAVARVGLLRRGPRLSLSLRIDASEALRITGDEFSAKPMAAVDRFIDDAALFWTPRVWLSMVLGRYKVPFSRYRQLERGRLTTASVPFVVERLGPDRRWGATLYGDVGAMAYALGAYEDIDAMEARPVVPEPVDEGGRALVSGYLGWIPRAPIGPDHMATPPSDPWFDTLRLFGGIGVLWRAREGGNRLDISLGGQLKYRAFAMMGELFVYSDAAAAGMSGALHASLLVTRRAVVFVRGEYDLEVEDWGAGSGAAVFITTDRRNKATLTGWIRRSFDRTTRGHGVLISLQAAL